MVFKKKEEKNKQRPIHPLGNWSLLKKRKQRKKRGKRPINQQFNVALSHGGKQRISLDHEQYAFQQHTRTRILPRSYVIGPKVSERLHQNVFAEGAAVARGVGGGRGVGPKPTRARTFCLARVWPAVTCVCSCVHVFMCSCVHVYVRVCVCIRS